jgi:hypothetical protein
VSARIREVLGEVDHACHSCGQGCPVAIETRLKPFWDAFWNGPARGVRRYETCLDCGTTVRVRPVNPRPVGGVDPFGQGWVAL